MTPYEEFERLRPSKEIIANEISIEFNSILEVGAQYGENLLALERKFPDKKIIGVDIDEKTMIEGRHYLSKAKMIYGDARKLPFPDNSFDIVFTNALICMLEMKDISIVLKEIIRVAKKQVLLIELRIEEGMGQTPYCHLKRMGANWQEILKEYNPIIKKLTPEEFDANPWLKYGYLIKLKL